MGRCVSFLLLLGVALALAVAANGDMSGAFAGMGTAYSIDAAVQQLMPPPSSSMRLEDGVAPELSVDLEVHRRVLAGISPGALNRNRPNCPGACPAPGGSYTNRGCQRKYQCRG